MQMLKVPPINATMNSLGEFYALILSSMGVCRELTGKTSTTGILSHVLSNITDTSYLIGDGTGRGSKGAKYFVFESDEYERHFYALPPRVFDYHQY